MQASMQKDGKIIKQAGLLVSAAKPLGNAPGQNRQLAIPCIFFSPQPEPPQHTHNPQRRVV